MSQMLGLALVLVSLLFDGLTGARQDDWTNRSTAPNGLQLMFGMNVWASAQLIAALLVTGQLREPLALVLAHPLLLLDMAAFCVISALGQKFIFLTVSSFSALACSIITTTRKFFTILASVVYFQHPLSVGQWLSVALVFIALGACTPASTSPPHAAPPPRLLLTHLRHCIQSQVGTSWLPSRPPRALRQPLAKETLYHHHQRPTRSEQQHEATNRQSAKAAK